MIVKLLTEHYLELLSLKGGCRGSSESTLVKMLEISCHGSYVLVKLSPDIYIFSCIFEKDVSVSLMGIVSICNHRLFIITTCVRVCVKHPINS